MHDNGSGVRGKNAMMAMMVTMMMITTLMEKITRNLMIYQNMQLKMIVINFSFSLIMKIAKFIA